MPDAKHEFPRERRQTIPLLPLSITLACGLCWVAVGSSAAPPAERTLAPGIAVRSGLDAIGARHLYVTDVRSGGAGAASRSSGMGGSGPIGTPVEPKLILAQIPGSEGRARTVILQSGRAAVLDFRSLRQVVIADPEVADVAPVSRSELVVTAKAPGETTLVVWDQEGRHSFLVRVPGPEVAPPPAPVDLREVAEQLETALDDPRIRVRPLGDTLFLEGTVPSDTAARRAESMARALTAKVVSLVEVSRPEEPAPPPAPPAGERVATLLNEALEGTGAKARAIAPDTVLLEGRVEPDDVERVRAIVTSAGRGATVVDALRVTPVIREQILVRARVVDINRNRLKDLGVDWGQLSVTGEGGNTQTSVVDPPILFSLARGDVRSVTPLGARLNLLIQENAARILSEPNLLVLEGATGNILVGGEFPIPTVQNQTGGAGAVTVQFREFGVRLEVEAMEVNEADIILRVMPEVSLLDFANAVRVSGFTLPALRTRREESTIRIQSGQTLAIGGLIESNYSRSIRKIPLLGDIPVLGQLFQSKSWMRNESELVILITPEVVPAGASVTPTPLSREAPNYPIPRPSVPPEVRPPADGAQENSERRRR